MARIIAQTNERADPKAQRWTGGEEASPGLPVPADPAAAVLDAPGSPHNPVGLAWEPETQGLWTTVNERDELGCDLVPDYTTSVQDDGFYGWPYSYFGAHVDEPQRPDLVGNAIVPDYALGPHTASLALAFADGAASLPPQLRRGAFVGQHGSWEPQAAQRLQGYFRALRGRSVGGRSRGLSDRFRE
jgi:glucose/arabinose dehydrogenase